MKQHHPLRGKHKGRDGGVGGMEGTHPLHTFGKALGNLNEPGIVFRKLYYKVATRRVRPFFIGFIIYS